MITSSSNYQLRSYCCICREFITAFQKVLEFSAPSPMTIKHFYLMDCCKSVLVLISTTIIHTHQYVFRAVHIKHTWWNQKDVFKCKGFAWFTGIAIINGKGKWSDKLITRFSLQLPFAAIYHHQAIYEFKMHMIHYKLFLTCDFSSYSPPLGLTQKLLAIFIPSVLWKVALCLHMQELESLLTSWVPVQHWFIPQFESEPFHIQQLGT